jgi:hypothetical protein
MRSSRAGKGGFSVERAMKRCCVTMVKTREMHRREAYERIPPLSVALY